MMPPQGSPQPDAETRAGARLVPDDDSLDQRSRGASESRPAARASAEPRRVRRTPSAICWRSTSTRRRCCRPTTRRTDSTTSPTRWASRPCCSSGTWRRPARSARSRLATRTPARRAKCSASARTRRRTFTSKACRSAPSAGSSRRRRCRSTARTIFRSSCSARTSASCAASSTNTSSNTRWTATRVHVSSVGGEEDFRANLKNMTKAGDDVEARAHVRIPLKAGPHVITAAFLERSDAINPLRLQPFIRSSNDTLDTIGHPHLDTFTLTGPFNATGPGDTPSRRKIFTCRPSQTVTEDACARRIVSTLARRAYRGQVSSADLERLHEFFLKGRKLGTFDTGIQTALQRILASPKFSFRVERDPGRRGAGARCTASATSSSRRACRSSSGAAFRTISCCASRPRARCTRRPCSRSRCGACWPTRRPKRSSPTSPASGSTCAT